MKKISIQGIKGAFHEEAAKTYFREELEIVPHLTFSELVKAVESGESDLGIIAIENTIAGTIHQNLRLIQDHEVRISGEQKLRIVQNLGVLNGTTLNELTEVRSHYMALHQCQKFFSAFPHIKLVEVEDTALSALQVAEENLKTVGAIASIEAINHYGLDTIEKSIETNKKNFTRFYILERTSRTGVLNGTKAVLNFTLKHEVGALAGLLSAFQRVNASLTKIESSPIIGQPWEYQFFIELEFLAPDSLEHILNLLPEHTVKHDLLGVYHLKNQLA
ncbi:MAG: prephenate dehydratase [Flavobacteriales bacterium]